MSSESNDLIAVASEKYKSGNLKPKKKCCGKCAFRKGSPERSDPYAWMQLVETWVDGKVPFFCHEGVPGHSLQVEGEILSVCAGYHSSKNTPPHKLYDLAELNMQSKREESDVLVLEDLHVS